MDETTIKIILEDDTKPGGKGQSGISMPEHGNTSRQVLPADIQPQPKQEPLKLTPAEVAYLNKTNPLALAGMVKTGLAEPITAEVITESDVATEAKKRIDKRERERLIQNEVARLESPGDWMTSRMSQAGGIGRKEQDDSQAGKLMIEKVSKAGRVQQAEQLFGIKARGDVSEEDQDRMMAHRLLSTVRPAAIVPSKGMFEKFFESAFGDQAKGILSRAVASGVGGAAGSAVGGVGGAAVGGAAGSLVASLGPVGVAAGTAALGITALGAAAKKVTDALLDRAEKLAHLSPDLALAQANKMIREFRTDLLESQTLGPGAGKLVDATSRIENMIRRALIPLEKLAASGFGAMATVVADALATSLATLNAIGGGAASVAEKYTAAAEAVAKGFLEVMKHTKSIDEKTDRKELSNPILDDFFKLEHGLPTIARPPDVLERARSERLGVPEFAGL